MAKNWTASEAIEAIKNNDKEAIIDIGKRFPLFAHFAACDATEIVKALPEYLTTRKIEGILKGDLSTEDADTDEEVNEVAEKKSKKSDDKPAKKAKKKPVDEEDEEDDDDEEEDEDEEPVKPAKKSKKKEEKPTKKSKKKSADDDDDDDDWDL